MRVLYLGGGGCYPESGYHVAHGSGGRELGLAWGLVRAGAEVHIGTHDRNMRGPTREGLVRVGYDTDPAGYDTVVLCGVTGTKSSDPASSYYDATARERLVAHGNVWVQLDSTFNHRMPHLDYVRGLGFSCQWAVDEWHGWHPEHDAFLLPWGYPDVLTLADPWPEGEHKPRVLFAGIAQEYIRRHLLELVELAGEDYEFWFLGLTMSGEAWGCASDEDRASLYHPRMRWTTDVSRSWGCAHGPQLYGPPVWQFIQHADCGLSFSADTRAPISAKLYDYLACGLPSVTQACPNAADMLALDAGEVTAGRSPADTDTAIRKVLSRQYDREAIRRGAVALGTWTDSARTLLAHVETPRG